MIFFCVIFEKFFLYKKNSSHGREKVFSSQGIKITVDYFKRRGLTDIVAIVPEFRRTNLKGEFPTKNPEILEELYENKVKKFYLKSSYYTNDINTFTIFEAYNVHTINVL